MTFKFFLKFRNIKIAPTTLQTLQLYRPTGNTSSKLPFEKLLYPGTDVSAMHNFFASKERDWNEIISLDNYKCVHFNSIQNLPLVHCVRVFTEKTNDSLLYIYRFALLDLYSTELVELQLLHAQGTHMCGSIEEWRYRYARAY